jgi:hypothetical protein
LAVVATVLGLLVWSGVAAGSAQNASPKKWVAGFCGSALTWQKTLKSGLAELTATVQKYQNGDVGLPAVKTTVVKFLDKSVKATDGVIKELKALGPPAVKNGAVVQQGELRAFGQAKTVFQKAEKTAKGLSTSNAQTFGKGLTAVGHSITVAGQKISAAETKLEKYATKALTTAARHNGACRAIGAYQS